MSFVDLVFRQRFGIKSFRLTVVALVWASVAVPVLILCLYQLRDDYEQRLASNRAELERRAERASFVIAQELRQMMSDLDRIASDGTVIRSLSFPMLSPLSSAKLDSFLKENSAAVNIISLDRELFPVEILPDTALTADLSAYKTFMDEVIAAPESIRDPRPRLFLSVPDKNTGTRQILFVRPILTANNSISQPFVVTGLLFATISSEKLIAELREKDGAEFPWLQLYSQQQLVYSSKPHADIQEQQRVDVNLGREDQALSLVFGSSSQGVARQVLMAYRAQGLMALLFIAAMGLVTKVLADKLGKPLSLLSRLTRNLSSGQMEPLPGIDSIHYQEFTEVFSLLNNMQATIRQQFDQLYEANAHLEEKVAQRTDALERNILLLDKQQQSLSNLVKYAISIQQLDGLDDIGSQTRQVAEHICEQGVGVYLARGEGFSGYLDYEALPPDARQLLNDKADQLRDYEGLVALMESNELLQIFSVGSTPNSYQGFLTTTKSQLSGRVHETLMVLCSILGSSLKQHNLTNRLDRLAHMDSVTRLPNRHYFNSVFADRQSHFDVAQAHTHFAVFVVDVNGLKPVNDTYGHEHGDQMLRQVAEALGRVVRPRDTVARVGGDEFYMILERANQKTCEQFAQRLRELQKDMCMDIGDKNIPITFSLGFASTDMDSLKNLIALADERMYFAKKKHYQNLQAAQMEK